MKSILAIAKYTVIEQIRNRLYLIILFFGFGILGSSLLLGALAPGYRVRVIFDLGLFTLEIFGLATAIFGAVSLVLQEVESKTIYLLLTRPLPRSYYIVGRFLGLIVAVALTMVVMALLHIVILHLNLGWFKAFTADFSFWAVYPTLVMMSILKMLITAAVAIFFSLFATSSVSALIFTLFFWVAGHFGQELQFLIGKTMMGFYKWAAQAVSYILPNYHYLNFRDTYDIPAIGAP